ncbi:MAG: hypothetical protein AABY16_03370 [Nanoarchaeota archaeon]
MRLRPILRRGDLTNNLLSAILAIGGLLMLAFLGVKLYNFFVSQEEKNAAAFLDSLQAKIDALDETDCVQYPQASPPDFQLSPQGCIVNNTFVLRGVKGWFLAAWNKSDSLNVKPEKCFDKNCLCVCNGAPDKNTCQENGLCRETDRPVFLNFTLAYTNSENYKDNVDDITVYKDNFVESYCTYLISGLMPFNVAKSTEGIAVSYNYGVYNNPNILLFNRISVGGKGGMFSQLRQCPRFLRERDWAG